ncbi:MAG: hypothetical protein WC389_19735 [Lutibacter sp.]|jgi:hypothetical protein
MKKDWTGNSKSVFTPLASSQHSEGERQINDYYATEPRAAELLLELETFSQNIWECACGEGHLSKVFVNKGFNVKSTDLINRGYGDPNIDFLSIDNQKFEGDIITNPPFIYAKEFIIKALEIIPTGYHVAMFLKVQFMEGKGRKDLFINFPPKRIWISSSRINCAKNGDFKGLRTSGGSAVAYAWYIWEKGYKGETILKWFN